MPNSISKNDDQSHQMMNRLRVPLNETSYKLTINEMEKQNERQKKSDLYKELMSAYNLKNINEDHSNHQEDPNVIRKDFPSDYTKSNIPALSNVFLENQ